MEKSKGMQGEVLRIQSMSMPDCDESTDAQGEGVCWYGFWDIVHDVLVVFDDRILVAYIEDLYSGPAEFTVVEGSVIALTDISAVSAMKDGDSRYRYIEIKGPSKQKLKFTSFDSNIIGIIQENTGLEVPGNWDETAP